MLVDWSLEQPVEVPGLPVAWLSREQVAAELVRRQRRQAMDAAYEAELILRLAELSPDDADPEPGTPGARNPGWSAERDIAGVSEFFASELALVINRGRGTANHQPGVAAQLTITATLGSLTGDTAAAGTVNGLVITAAHARELLARIGALGLRAPDGGSLTFAITDAHGRLLAATTVTELLRAARTGCPAHPHRDSDRDCDCPVLGAPADTGAYPPTTRQRRFVTTRDRTCRMPGCGQRAGWADLGHVVAHADGGATGCTNLCCLCRSDHRLKTFARGWAFRMDTDGTLHVTTPTGITRTTRPPGLRPPPPQPPPDEPDEPDDDPPPF